MSKKYVFCPALTGLYRPEVVEEFTVDTVSFSIGYAEGVDTGGFIGTDKWGIFMYCLTDKRGMFKGYQAGVSATTLGVPQLDMLRGEIYRIVSMDREQLESFLNFRGVYNPFLDRRLRLRVAKADKKLRSSIHWSDFSTGRWMTDKTKRQLAHEYERFLVARIFGGAGFARTRFTNKVYALLKGPYGHSAHFDLAGFYTAQMHSRASFKENLRLVREKMTVYGMSLGQHTVHIIDLDILDCLSRIAGDYSAHTPVEA